MLRSTLSHLAVVGEDLADVRVHDCGQCNESLWLQLRREAEEAVAQEPMLASLFFESIINQPTFEEAVFHRVGTRLKNDTVPLCLLTTIFRRAVNLDRTIGVAMRADIAAVMERDRPAVGFSNRSSTSRAFTPSRPIGWPTGCGRRTIATLPSICKVAHRMSSRPTSTRRLGSGGDLLDHATGLVVGATAVVDDDVSILQNVTLGGTGKESGDRHPKIRRGVMIGAGAKILGNIEVGESSRIAAGSVVLRPVPANVTVAGVPARQVGLVISGEPSQTMDQILNALTWDAIHYEI